MTVKKAAERTGPRVDTGTVLYYPNFRMRVLELKQWLLFWDKVRCIVPKTRAIHDDSEIAEAVGAGCLEDTRPEDYQIDAADEFRAKVFPLLSERNRRSRVFLNNLQSNRGDSFAMHVNKMSPGLLNELVSRGFARKDDERDWISIRSAVGGLYMVCLASVMSDDLHAPMVTDHPEFGDAGEYLLFGSFPIGRREIPDRSALAQLGLTMPSPEDLTSVPMDRILRFREKYAGEMAHFRNKLQGILETAAQVESKAALKDFFSTKRKEIEECVRDHQLSLSELALTGITSLLKMSLPASATAVANHLTNYVQPGWLGLAGISVLIAGWWAEISGKRRKAARECPWLYASRIERELRPRRRMR